MCVCVTSPLTEAGRSDELLNAFNNLKMNTNTDMNATHTHNIFQPCPVFHILFMIFTKGKKREGLNMNSHWSSLKYVNPTKGSWFPAKALGVGNVSTSPLSSSMSSKLLVSISLLSSGTTGATAAPNTTTQVLSVTLKG